MTILRKGISFVLFLFLKIFIMWTICRVFTEFVNILLGFCGHKEYGILPPQPGTESACPASEAGILTTGLPGQSQDS